VRLRGRALALVAFALAVLAGVSACGGAGSSGPPKTSTSQQHWTFAAAMPRRRSYTASAEIGGNIYVAAGMVGNTGMPLSLFERFDPATDSWTDLPDLPVAFRAGAGAAIGDRMYVVGGNSGGGNGHQVFSYDIQTHRWRSETPLPAPRTNLAVVALGGKIYAIGGLDPLYASRTVFVYSPATRRWSQAAPLPVTLQAAAAVVFHGQIWVLGGADKAGAIQRKVWIYDPRKNTWRAGPAMPTPLETLGAAVDGQRIYVVLETHTFVYDAGTRKWTRGATLEVSRHALSVFVADGHLYAIGGCKAPQLEDSPIVEKLNVS
jgi:N-acetylneuraminic acid mutarotase